MVGTREVRGGYEGGTSGVRGGYEWGTRGVHGGYTEVRGGKINNVIV